MALWKDGPKVGHGIGSGFGSLGINIGRGGIGPVGDDVGLGMACFTPFSGIFDGSGVGVIPSSGLTDIDGCNDGGNAAEGWVTFPNENDEVGSPDGGITSSGLGGAIDPDVSSVGDNIGAVLVGSTPCIMGNVVGSGVIGTTGSYTVGAMGFCTGGPKVGHGVGSGVALLGMSKGCILGGFSPVRVDVGPGVGGSTLHSGTSDGSGVGLMPGSGLPHVAGCSDGGVPTEGWTITPLGADAVGSAVDGIIGSGLGGEIGSGVGDTIGAV